MKQQIKVNSELRSKNHIKASPQISNPDALLLSFTSHKLRFSETCQFFSIKLLNFINCLVIQNFAKQCLIFWHTEHHDGLLRSPSPPFWIQMLNVNMEWSLRPQWKIFSPPRILIKEQFFVKIKTVNKPCTISSILNKTSGVDSDDPSWSFTR